MTKTVQVVMLPTIEKNWPKGRITKCIGESIYVPLGKLEIDNIGHKLPNYMINTLDYWEPQHLYFTSDDEIREGEVCLRDYGMGHELVTYKSEYGNTCRKIIASTDPALGLPLIPQQWIRDVFILNNGLIKEVELEIDMEYEDWYERMELKTFLPYWEPALTSNNEVIISGFIQAKAVKMTEELLSVLPDSELEEAANHYVYHNVSVKDSNDFNNNVESFKAGAAWQQEQSENETIKFVEWLREWTTEVFINNNIMYKNCNENSKDFGNYFTLEETYELWKKNK